MERDWKLIYKILTYIRDNADGRGSLPPPSFACYSGVQVDYHIRLCAEAKLIRYKLTHSGVDGEAYTLLDLTWEGHNVLDEGSK